MNSQDLFWKPGKPVMVFGIRQLTDNLARVVFCRVAAMGESLFFQISNIMESDAEISLKEMVAPTELR